MTVGRPGSPGPELRIGDSDREAAISALGEHYAAGRLTKQEYDERSDAAWAARTGSDLAPLFADLPRQAGPVSASTQDRVRPRRDERRRWAGAPVLLVALLAFFVLTHLFPLLLLVVLWLMWSRMWRFHSVARRRDRWVR